MKKFILIVVLLVIMIGLIVAFYLSMVTKAQSLKSPPPMSENAYYFLNELCAQSNDLSYRLAQIPNIMTYKRYYVPRRQVPYTPGVLVPNFLDIQVNTKLFRIAGIFYLLEGKRSEALELFAACYYTGKLLRRSNLIIARLIGMAVCQIANGGLMLYALNACETEEDFKTLWERLDELAKDIPGDTVEECFLNEHPINRLRVLVDRSLRNAIKDCRVREKTVEAKFELTRMAVAVRYHLLVNGKFPETDSEFGPLLPDGPLKDPFSGKPFRFINKGETGSFVCYSIGPDEIDNRGGLYYDPTNGTVSPGDIIIKIPKERKYPFPREGVKATTAEELRKLFPNGLPPDPFANTRGKPLGISNTMPVCVYSYGPDTDEEEALPYGESYVPEVMYDPSNGTISNGDLFMQIPLRDMEKEDKVQIF
ncbi:hypothetical protein J7M23_07310 [Candidatus Sumerlaeota bacterium]|nr:hypothetical protein [Candidatus Sumerlaeota bacterium]